MIGKLLTTAGITFAWLKREAFPRPCDFCGAPIKTEYAYRIEEGRYRCERCLCNLEPAPLQIHWMLSVDTWTPEGEKDAFEPLGFYPTLEDCYEAAKIQPGRFNIAKWYTRNVGSCGPTLWKGWADTLPPIEEIRAQADGEEKPMPLGPCVTCGERCAIVCGECRGFTCWDHRHNYGTHHEAKYRVGDTVPWGQQQFRITQAHAERLRWTYAGNFLNPDGSEGGFAIGVRESDLQ